MSTKLVLKNGVSHRCDVCARLYSNHKGTAQLYHCRECFVEKPIWFCARCRLACESDGGRHHGHIIEARSSAEMPSSRSGTNKNSVSVDGTEMPSLPLTSEEPPPPFTPKLRMATYEELLAAAAAHGQREVHPASLHHLERAHTLLARAGEAWINDVIELEYATAVADGWLEPRDCIVREVSADIRQEMNFGLAELELRKAEEWIKEMWPGLLAPDVAARDRALGSRA
ncbi:hypothetical protein LTR54_009002 [Friedmanniomyces endolithicus]|nr:hypothetical protein LTR01_001636 [Friedmanniomyces endolithicus]KAK1000079.1 hypothetical protein LTR54_009002 [Friedmanniomyces endolithicus]